MIKRYWFEFSDAKNSLPIGVSSGCGLSAYSYDDALVLLKESVFENSGLPTITKHVEDIDVSTLDQGQVIPNMGDVTIRGVWFPLGY